MYLFSIQFTLSMFFTAFHCLVLASFCSSKNPDLIQCALFLNQTAYSPHVRHLKGRQKIESRNQRVETRHRFLLCPFHCSLRQSSCAESTLLLYQGVPLHVSLFSQGSTMTESSYQLVRVSLLLSSPLFLGGGIKVDYECNFKIFL